MPNPLAELFVRLTLDDREFQHQLADVLGELERVESPGAVMAPPARRGAAASGGGMNADNSEVVALLTDIRQALSECKGLLQTIAQRGNESRLASP